MAFVLGGGQLKAHALPCWGELQIDFLNALSAQLKNHQAAAQFPDVLTFAFWCRRANLARLKGEMNDSHLRLGLGNVLHITPANVPVNFAYSYAFGLLAGNANWVRLPSQRFTQIDIICEALSELCQLPQYQLLANYSHFFRYQHNQKITDELSARCFGRIIWGGNNTINEIRKSPLPVRAVDLAFADRTSLCVLGSDELARMSENEIDRLANEFYNDTYLMDQNACSSPHLIIWLGDAAASEKAQRRFWPALSRLVHYKYKLSAKAAIDKHILFCQNAIELPEISQFDVEDTALYRAQLVLLPPQIAELRGRCGYFYEFVTNDLDSLASKITPEFQTATCAGIDRQWLADWVLRQRLGGIDRIVRVGRALEMGVIWDGFNVIHSLSRIIDV